MANTKVKAEQLEAAQTNITSLGTLTALTVDDITIDGSTISDGGDLTIDVAAEINLDADGGKIRFKDGGTEHLRFVMDNAGVVQLYSAVQDADIKIQGNDGGSVIDALTFDMSKGGDATFVGNVGIGATPKTWHSGWEALQIGERAAFFSQASTTTGIGENVYYNSGWKAIATAAGSLYQQDSGNHHFYTMASVSADATSSPSEKFTILNNGKVGIGINPPIMKLHVKGSTGDVPSGDSNPPANGIAIFDSGGGYSLVIGTDDSNTGSAWIQSQSANVSSSNYDLLLNPNGGLVGIGTTNAYDRFQVTRTSTSQTAGMTLENLQPGGYGSGITWESKRSDANNVQTAARLSVQGWNSWNSDSTSSSAMIFHVRHSNSLDEVMRIASNQLIVGSTSTSLTDTTKNIIYKSGGMGNVYNMSSTNEWWIMNNLASNSGYTTKIDFRTQNTSRGYIGITGSTVQYYGNSDYRLKENYKYDFDATSLIKAMKPLQFTWKDEPMRGTQTGFLAHELKEVCPYVVEGEKDAMREDDDSKIRPQVVDQGKLVAVLTKALQEAITRIEALEAK